MGCALRITIHSHTSDNHYIGSHHTTVSSLVFLSSSAKFVPLNSTTVTLLLLVCADLAAVARACRLKQRLSAVCYDCLACKAELPVSIHLTNMVLHPAALQHCAVQPLQVSPAIVRFNGCASCFSLSWCMRDRRRCLIIATSGHLTSALPAAVQVVLSLRASMSCCERRE